MSLSRRDESVGLDHGWLFTESNEPALFKTFEFIRDKEGVAVGVGVDQMFDIACNAPQLNRIVLLDNQWTTSLVSEALLLVGSHHKKDFDKYPTPEEFIAYFAPENVDKTMAFLQQSIAQDKDDFSALKGVLTQKQDRFFNYLHTKSHPDTAKEFTSWLSSAGSLAHILTMYDERRVHFIHGDLAETEKAPVAELLRDTGESVSVIYLSNAETYLAEKRGGPIAEFIRNLNLLPVAPNTTVIQAEFVNSELLPQVPTPTYARTLPTSIYTWRYRVVSWDMFQRSDLREREEKLVMRGNPEELGIQQYAPGIVVSTDILEAQKASEKGKE